MPNLAELIRAKHPGSYDDLDDKELEKAVLDKHPEYKDLATPKEPKMLSKVVDAVVNPKPFKPAGESKLTRFIESGIEKGKELFTGDPGLEDYLKSKGITGGVKGPGFMEIPGVSKIAESIRRRGRESGNYYLGAAGSLAGDVLDFASTGFDPRTAGAKHLTPEEVPSVRQATRGTEIPYRMSSSIQDIHPYETVGPELPIRQPRDLSTARASLPAELRTAEEATGTTDIFSAPKGKGAEEAIFKNAQDKFNMGKEVSEEKPKFVNPFEKKTNIKDKELIGQEGSIGPHNDMSPERVVQSVINGDKPAAILDNGGEKMESLVKYAKTNGLHIIDNPIVSDEPILAKDKATGEALVESLKNGDHETTGKLLGYSEDDIAKFKENLPVEGETTETKTSEPNTPENLHPQLTALKNHGDGVLTLEFDKNANIKPDDITKMLSNKNIEVTELPTTSNPNNFRIDVKSSSPASGRLRLKDLVNSSQHADDIERSVGGSFDKNKPSQNLSSESGMAVFGRNDRKGPQELEPFKGAYGAALDKLFNAMGQIKESRVQQDIINKVEQAKRFAAFSSVKEEGVSGAKKSLSALKGEFEKVDTEKLGLTRAQSDSLFTAVKRANITEGEKARGYTALFKLMNGDGVPQRNELAILDNVFGQGFADKVIQMHGGIGAVGIKLAKAANTMKSLENSISLAAPLRHGIGLAYRSEFYPAMRDMFKFFTNPEFYKSSMQAIEEHPNYLKARDSGLFLNRPGSVMNSEEEFLNSYVGSLPRMTGIPQTVAASQRAYSGFLNKLRFDTFNSMIKQAEDLGVNTFSTVGGNLTIPSKEAKAISRFINNATGRGSLGPLDKATNELNMLLWSPRMISSRISMLTNPKIYTDLPKGMRLEGLKSLFAIAALGTSIDTLASYGGAKVSTNILSTDFGKSRFGKKLIDPWGGFQQYVVAAARFLAGKTDSSQPTSRLEIAGRFLANKESPAASLAHMMLTAKKFTGGGNFTTQYGQQTSIQSEIAKRFTPIFLQDLKDLAAEQPSFADEVGLNTALGVASLAGMSQQYPEKGRKKLSFNQKLGVR